MRTIISAFFVLILVGCGNNNSDSEIGSEGFLADSTELVSVSDSEVEEIPLPTEQVEIEENIEEIVEKSATSVVAKEACCEDITVLQACCCDKVLEKYEGFMKAENYDAAMKLDGTDPYYPQCVKQFKNFESRIISIQDKYLN